MIIKLELTKEERQAALKALEIAGIDKPLDEAYDEGLVEIYLVNGRRYAWALDIMDETDLEGCVEVGTFNVIEQTKGLLW